MYTSVAFDNLDVCYIRKPYWCVEFTLYLISFYYVGRIVIWKQFSRQLSRGFFLPALHLPPFREHRATLLSASHSFSVHFHRNTVVCVVCSFFPGLFTLRGGTAPAPLAASGDEPVCRREQKKKSEGRVPRSEHEVPALLDPPDCNDLMSAARHFCHIRYVMSHAQCFSVGSAGLPSTQCARQKASTSNQHPLTKVGRDVIITDTILFAN